MKLVLPAYLRGSLALRIALASVLFGILVAGGTVTVGLWNLSHQMDERAALEMQGRRELLVNIPQTIPTVAAVVESKDHHFGHLFIGHDDLHLALQDAGTGKVLAAFSDTATHSVTALSHALSTPDTMHAWTAPGGKRFGGWHGSVKIADGSEVEYYLSVDRHRDTALLAGFTKATLLALPWLLVLVAVGAGLIARAGLAPVLKFKRLAASIGTKSLDRRIAPADLPNELADMAARCPGAPGPGVRPFLPRRSREGTRSGRQRPRPGDRALDCRRASRQCQRSQRGRAHHLHADFPGAAHASSVNGGSLRGYIPQCPPVTMFRWVAVSTPRSTLMPPLSPRRMPVRAPQREVAV